MSYFSNIGFPLVFSFLTLVPFHLFFSHLFKKKNGSYERKLLGTFLASTVAMYFFVLSASIFFIYCFKGGHGITISYLFLLVRVLTGASSIIILLYGVGLLVYYLSKK